MNPLSCVLLITCISFADAAVPTALRQPPRLLVRTPHDICDNNGSFQDYETTTCHNSTFIAETIGTCDGNGNFDRSTATLTSCASYSGNPSLSHCHDCSWSGGAKVVCAASSDTQAVCPNHGEVLPCSQLPGNNYWANYAVCTSDSGFAVRRENCQADAVVATDIALSTCHIWTSGARPFCHVCGEVFFCEQQQYGCSAVGLDQLNNSAPTPAPSPSPSSAPTTKQQASTTNGTSGASQTSVAPMAPFLLLLSAGLYPLISY